MIKNTIVQLAMPRSGHNAIGIWITEQQPLGAITDTFRMGVCRLHSSMESMHKDRDLFLIQFETLMPSNFKDFFSIPTTNGMVTFDELAGPCLRKRILLCLRDPFNFYASYSIRETRNKKAQGQDVNNFPRMLEIYVDFLYEYVRKTKHISDLDIITLNYNKWFMSEKYREEVFALISPDCTFNDKGLNNVFLSGGEGSTFDGMQFNGSAQRMDTLNRWKHLIGSRGAKEDFEFILKKYSDFSTLTQEVFEDIPVDSIIKQITN
jgi:hypothetical protein